MRAYLDIPDATWRHIVEAFRIARGKGYMRHADNATAGRRFFIEAAMNGAFELAQREYATADVAYYPDGRRR